MTAKEYLSRAYKLDKRMDSKIDQIQSLRDLAHKTTAVLSHEPKSGTRNVHPMETALAKLMDAEVELAKEMEELLDLKHEIGDVIDSVADVDCRLLLEYRYISLKSWEDICSTLDYSWRSIHRLHQKALEMIQTKIQSWHTLL